jgi:hypothetical protein
MNLYHIKLTDDQKDALERLFDIGIVWSKTELSEAWEQLREQLKDSVQCAAIINALQDSECNCKKPTEPAPKYDPCRKFRRGDIVRYVPHNGRECPAMPLDEYYRVKTLTVVEDEDANHRVLVETQDGRNKYIMFCYLELVTPVEELEPFEVYHRPSEWCVIKTANDLIASIYNVDIHPNAKAAAEAECARLNAEWGKEMEK